MPQSLFKQPTSRFGPRVATPEEIAAIEAENTRRESEWGPITKAIVNVTESIPGFFEGLMNDPTAARQQWEAVVNKPGGTFGTILGSLPFELVAPVAVAVGGGKALPGLRAKSVEMLKKLDTSKMPEYFNDWATYMLEKYPRVFSHNQNISPPRVLTDRVTKSGAEIHGLSRPLDKKESKLSEVILDKEPIFGGQATPDTAFHENWHSVQRRGPEDLTANYNAENARVGYNKNKYEQEANRAAEKQTPKFEAWRQQYNPSRVRINPEYLKQIEEPSLAMQGGPQMGIWYNSFDEAKFKSDPDYPKVSAYDPKYHPAEIQPHYLDPERNKIWDMNLDIETRQKPLLTFDREQKPIRFPEQK